MDNEKIKELAERYVKEEHYDDFFLSEATRVIQWLFKTHCIVEKNEARETLEELKEDARPVCEWDEKVVDVVTLEDTFIYLFGKELFNDKVK